MRQMRNAMARLSDLRGFEALVLYLTLSVAFFGRGLVGHMYTAHIGEGADPPLMMWCLVWWPDAIATRLNPFLTDVFWTPSGFNLTWTTSIPLLSVVAAPLTSVVGPVATLNLLCILALPAAAWSAFFLCRYLGADYWSSVIGGYIFGFCPTLLGQLVFGRLHSIWVFPVPMAVCLAVRRFRAEINSLPFTILLALLLVVAFLFSAETFATMTVFGGIALVLAWFFLPTEARERLLVLLGAITSSYAIAALTLSPFLYYMLFSYHPDDSTLWPASMMNADLLNFIVPSPINELGRLSWLDSLSAPFNLGVPAEIVAYLSPPLIVATIMFARRKGSEPIGKLLVLLLLVTLVLSAGDVLVVRGVVTRIALPWKLLGVSLLRNAAPVRFCMYASLILAIIVSLVLSSLSGAWLRLSLSVAIVLCGLPNLSADYWIYPVRNPAFFRDGLYQKYLKKGDTLLILPFWPRNDAMLWQAETDIYFRMAQGPGPWPDAFLIWPIVDAFSQREYIPDAQSQLRSYLTAKGVSALIIDDDSLPVWEKLASNIGVPVKVGGVSLYRLAVRQPDQPRDSADKIRERFDINRFELVLTSVQRYLSQGGNVNDLSAKRAPEIGVIDPQGLIGPYAAPPEVRHPELNWRQKRDYDNGVFLFTMNDRLVWIGEVAWQAGAKDLLTKYGSTAAEAHFVIPSSDTGLKRSEMGVVIMSFSRQQLANAAAAAAVQLRHRTGIESESAGIGKLEGSEQPQAKQF